MVLTDGAANIGITNQDQLCNHIKALLQDTDIRLSTFGYGTDHDPSMLQRLATEGKGMYYNVEIPDSVPAFVAEFLGGALAVMAQNAELTLSPLNGAVLVGIEDSKRPITKVGANFNVALGDFTAEQECTTLFYVTLPAGDETRYVLARVDFYDVNGKNVGVVEAWLEVFRPEVADNAQTQVNQTVVEDLGRLEVARAIEKAQRLADDGNRAAARETLQASLVRINALGISDGNYLEELRVSGYDRTQDCVVLH